jgi:broad specificity phosphatase PhoE
LTSVVPVRLHLVRHGEVENPRGLIYGALPGFGLSGRGRAHVREAAAHLRGLQVGAAEIVSSPLLRAVESAELLARELGLADSPRLDARLTEAGSWLEGLPRGFAPAAVVGRWLDPASRARHEPPGQVLARMVAVLSELRGHATGTAPRQVVIVSHQFPIRLARLAAQRGLLAADPASRPAAGMLLARAPWLFARARCALGSVTSLAFEAGRVTIDYWEPPGGRE